MSVWRECWERIAHNVVTEKNTGLPIFHFSKGNYLFHQWQCKMYVFINIFTFVYSFFYFLKRLTFYFFSCYSSLFYLHFTQKYLNPMHEFCCWCLLLFMVTILLAKGIIIFAPWKIRFPLTTSDKLFSTFLKAKVI